MQQKYKGKVFPSISALAESLQIAAEPLRRRLQDGIPVGEAVKKALVAKKRRKEIGTLSIIINGKKYTSIAEAAEQLQIPYKSFRARIVEKGMTPQQSFEAARRK